MIWPVTDPWLYGWGGWANGRGWSARQPDLVDKFCGSHLAHRRAHWQDLDELAGVLASIRLSQGLAASEQD